MTSQPVRFGVLGAGRIGKVHAANLANRVPGAQVAALCDVASAELAAVAKQLNIPKTVSDYRRVLDSPEIDAVAICTPTDTHHRIILDAAAAGKHIFCEKPIDLSLEKTLEAARASRAVKTMIGFNRRFDPAFAKLRASIAAGELGDLHILRISSRDPSPPPESYVLSSGGIFLDMTIHDFDTARFLAASEVVEVYARAGVLVDPMFARAGDFDTAIVTLTFANGAIGAIDNSRRAVYGYDQRVEAFGTKGMLEATNNSPHTQFFMDRYADAYAAEMREFVDAIRNDRAPTVGANDGVMAVVIGLAALKSARENRPVKPAEIFNGTI
jgi:myo-inositol 2-dehydrogenase / D-chiro-inositol 1-dehydrogenase